MERSAWSLTTRHEAGSVVASMRKPGSVVWFTGLSGSGKTTLARAVLARLRAAGEFAVMLDGDELRSGLCAGLGFSRSEREKNLRRAADVTDLLVRQGITVLIAMITPYRAFRQENCARFSRYVEVFVNTPLEVCEKRDPKGLYRRARDGEITHFTGVDDVYEPPTDPEVECRTDLESVVQSVDKILLTLRGNNGLPHRYCRLPEVLLPAVYALSRRRLGLAEFASLAHVPPHAAVRMIRAAAGVNFRVMGRELLAERARELLATGMAVKAVALELGFSCTESLDRFLRAAGVERTRGRAATAARRQGK